MTRAFALALALAVATPAAAWPGSAGGTALDALLEEGRLEQARDLERLLDAPPHDLVAERRVVARLDSPDPAALERAAAGAPPSLALLARAAALPGDRVRLAREALDAGGAPPRVAAELRALLLRELVERREFEAAADAALRYTPAGIDPGRALRAPDEDTPGSWRLRSVHEDGALTPAARVLRANERFMLASARWMTLDHPSPIALRPRFEPLHGDPLAARALLLAQAARHAALAFEPEQALRLAVRAVRTPVALSPETLAELGEAERRAGAVAPGIAHLEQAARAEPSRGFAMVHALLQARRATEALAWIERLPPPHDSAEVLELSAFAHAMAGDRAAARVAIDEVPPRLRDDRHYWITRAAVEVASAEPRRARAAANACARLPDRRDGWVGDATWVADQLGLWPGDVVPPEAKSPDPSGEVARIPPTVAGLMQRLLGDRDLHAGRLDAALARRRALRAAARARCATYYEPAPEVADELLDSEAEALIRPSPGDTALVQRLVEAGRLDDALEVLDPGVYDVGRESLPASPALASIYAARGDRRSTATALAGFFPRAVQEQPRDAALLLLRAGSAEGLCNLAFVLAVLKDPPPGDDTVAILGLAGLPDHALARRITHPGPGAALGQGLALLALGRAQRGDALLERASAPGSPWARQAIAARALHALDAGDGARAAPLLAALERDRSDDLLVPLVRGRLTQSVPDLEEARRRAVHDGRPRLALAHLQPERALALLEEAVRVEPSSRAAWLALGEARAAAGGDARAAWAEAARVSLVAHDFATAAAALEHLRRLPAVPPPDGIARGLLLAYVALARGPTARVTAAEGAQALLAAHAPGAALELARLGASLPPDAAAPTSGAPALVPDQTPPTARAPSPAPGLAARLSLVFAIWCGFPALCLAGLRRAARRSLSGA